MAKKAKPASALRIVPLGDKVVLRRQQAADTTAGGIVLPDTARDKPQKGEVVAVGDGHTRDDGSKVALTVKEGDRVVTSGLVGGFPRGLAIGTITSIDREEGALFQTAELVPEVDVDRVEEVLVIQAPHGQTAETAGRPEIGVKPQP